MLPTAIVVSTLLLLGACETNSADQTRGGTPGAPNTSSPTSAGPPTSPDSSHSNPKFGPAKEVGGAKPLPERAFDRIGRFPSDNEGLRSRVVDVGADGSVLRQELRIPALGDESEVTRDWLRLDNAVGKSIKIQSDQMRDDASIETAILADQRVLVRESTSEDLSETAWSLFDYDLDSQQWRKLADSPLMSDGGPAVSAPGWTTLEYEDGFVFWVQTSGERTSPHADIWGCELKDCEPREFIPGAAYPAISDGILYGLSSPIYAGDREASQKTHVVSLDLRSGGSDIQTFAELSTDAVGSALEVDSGRVLWIESKKSRPIIRITTLESRDVASFLAPRRGSFAYPILTEKYAAWAESSGTSRMQVGGFVFDFQSQELHTVGDTSGLYRLAGNGSVLSWDEASDAERGEPMRATSVVVKLREGIESNR